MYLPTKNNPLIIGTLAVFPDKMIYGNEIIPFLNIKNIHFYKSISKMNGITTDSTLDFKLVIVDEGGQKKVIKVVGTKFDKDAYLKENCNRKTKEQILLFHDFLSKVTFKTRLYGYLKELKEKQYFEYPDNFKIYENGDVYKGDKFKDNIKKAYDEERLSCGSSFKGLRSSNENPYDFTLYKNSGG